MKWHAFKLVSIMNDGRPKPGFVIRCQSCGIEDRVVSTGVPDHVIGRKFVQRGWLIGSSEKSDTCPACAAKKQKQKPETVKTEAVMQAERPREMQRDDRRLIFGKIDEVYIDAQRGYEPGWSDQRVATDLGVPLKWVSDIREENFGPEGMSGEARTAIAEVKQIAERVAAFEASLAKLKSDLEGVRPAMARAIKTAEDLERIYGKVRA